MAITTTSGAQIRPTESVHSVETMTQSTATTAQSVSTTHQVTTLGGGTATGFGVNTYELATGDGWELMEKVVQLGATGEAKLTFTGTSTGALIFQSDTDAAVLKQVAGTWHQIVLQGATLATAT